MALPREISRWTTSSSSGSFWTLSTTTCGRPACASTDSRIRSGRKLPVRRRIQQVDPQHLGKSVPRPKGLAGATRTQQKKVIKDPGGLAQQLASFGHPFFLGVLLFFLGTYQSADWVLQAETLGKGGEIPFRGHGRRFCLRTISLGGILPLFGPQ